MSEKIKIEKGSVQETLIIPLYGRKLCAEQFPTLYRDEFASKLCDSLAKMYIYQMEFTK
jgi:O-methyltransferase involved in polyketide biosynthesis